MDDVTRALLGFLAVWLVGAAFVMMTLSWCGAAVAARVIIPVGYSTAFSVGLRPDH